MFGSVARQLFGTRNDRVLKALEKSVEVINGFETEISALSDKDLQAKTAAFKKRLEAGETLDDILFEAFAVVRETAKRTLGERHYDVQLMGGIVLHQGKITEMRTGEGKTLVSTLPVYLNALSGKGVHVVTVNDYLAKRDSQWMAQVHEFLGLTVGCVQHAMSDEERRGAYACDITYGTNNEFGFDYLRDNMKFNLSDMVQRPFNYAIIDEVDSILIDEARTPLIISGPAEDTSEMYIKLDALVKTLAEEHFEKDEKMKSVTLTEEGVEKMEALLKKAGLLESENLYDIENMALVHHTNMALKAHQLFTRDKDYIVKEDKVVIIDEFTGRMMEGRRYSEGLHQAIEAKEHVTIQRENQTLASITFQNYFRLYPKLGGMTGTAMTEAEEFAEIYGLDVVEMATNKPIARLDEHDEIYRSIEEKNVAMTQLVKECVDRGQPVLVGTTSIEKSEALSALFKKAKIKHSVLNARHHEQEASIVSLAGRPGAVTIATNMAGRGTDIKLGGNVKMMVEAQLKGDETEAEIKKLTEKMRTQVDTDREKVLNAGGLYVVGTERHESRRIDNQLRGRSGRQGDPGASKFFLSLEDDLMRIFGSERMSTILTRLGLKEGEAIIHPWINKAIERAQKKVEAQHFDARKNLLKYDDVMNDQRKAIYEQRRELMEADDVSEIIKDMRDEVVETIVTSAIPKGAYKEQWNIDTLKAETQNILALDVPIEQWADEEGIADDEIIERLASQADAVMAKKAADATPKIMRQVEKGIVLQILDQVWKEHLTNLDHLKQGIVLRAYGQRDPLNEYKSEAFMLFQDMLYQLRESVTQMLMRIELRGEDELKALERRRQEAEKREMQAIHEDPASISEQPVGAGPVSQNPDGSVPKMTPIRKVAVDPANETTWGATPRNASCPCGSGKKYKHCHGKLV